MLNDTLFYSVKVMMTTENNEILFNFSNCNPVYSNPILISNSKMARDSELTVRNVNPSPAPAVVAIAVPVRTGYQ